MPVPQPSAAKEPHSPDPHASGAGAKDAEAAEQPLSILQRALMHDGHPNPGGMLALQQQLGNQLIQRLAMTYGPTATRTASAPTTVIDLPALGHDHGADGVAVQRHSSWEHRMLGDTDPRKIAAMASISDIGKEQSITVGNDESGQWDIPRKDIQHALEEEISRLEQMRDSSLFKGTLGSKNVEAAEAKIREWGMEPIRIVLEKGGYLVLSKGEVNTMPDFFGSVEEMKKHDPENLHAIIQGVREQSLRKIRELYGKFSGDKSAAAVDEGFEGAIGNTGYTKIPKFMQKAISSKATNVSSGAAGELGLMGTTGFGGGKTTPEDRPADSYKAVLARNACHFAPESWYVWAEHHKKALEMAQQSKAKADEAVAQRARANPPADAPAPAQPLSPDEKMKAVVKAMEAEKEAARLANEAKLTDAFGSHYLQDSFASGHLINKTEIMKWYTKWFDANPQFAEGDSRLNVFLSPLLGRDESIPKTRRTPTNKSEWAAAQGTAAQSGIGVSTGRYDTANAGAIKPTDPQSVENMGGSAAGRFAAAGLKIPPSAEPGTNSQKVLVWWQKQAIDNRKQAVVKVDQAKLKEIAGAAGLGEPQVLTALQNLVGDKIVVPESKSEYRLREVWIPDASSKAAFMDAIFPTKDPERKAQKDAAYRSAAKRATYKDFHKFMNSALLQAATSVVHDAFCQSGLSVLSKAQAYPYKIYGDDAMLASQSALGAVISANTSQMSTDNITSMLTDGRAKYGITDISNRFPSSVEITTKDGKQQLTLEQWHTGGVLKNYCESTLFPLAANDTVKGWVQMSRSELKGFADKISKDEVKPNVHSGEAF